jgi:Putative transposase/Transposase zinc-binding domain
MRCSMQDIFAWRFDAFAQRRSLHPRESRAAQCIRHCYTQALGSHTLRCPEGHFSAEQLHACGHRSCPLCSTRKRAAWIDVQLQRLLPCPHFHVVFTLPHELLPLWEFNRERLTQLFFDSVRSCTLQLMADPRHLGAMPGLLMSLHTWGRNLSHHPHIHALISAGGLTPDLRWRSTRQGYLLPLKPLQRLFSGKLLAGLSESLSRDQLHLPQRLPRSHWCALLRALYRKHWNIQINPAYDSARSVTLYLARYVSGGPLPKKRPLFLNHDTVSFDYTDHRSGASKRMHLHVNEFIARVLWHAPPKGVHTVRHAGLYATAAVSHHRQACIALSQAAPPTQQAVPIAPAPIIHEHPPPRCPSCAALLQRSFTAPRRTGERVQNEKPLFLSTRPDSTTAAPGPTPRSTGPPIAGRSRPRCLLSLRGQLSKAG